MTGPDTAPPLLRQAVDYALGCVDQVPPDGLRRPTPCRGWDLDALLCHLYESVCALREAAQDGEVALLPAAPPPADPVAAVRRGARELLDSRRERSCGAAGEPPQTYIGGMPVASGTVAFIGAVELAVHGWDIAQACGTPRPIPVPLALALLRRSPMLTGGADLFAAPVPVSPLACPGDRLVALLGRAPGG
ncbi:TIGR03086 family protein [Actinacidiphila paucisporea]|uniref:TIGR03086 family protein n=1 Tax=Actinacidiphila paucisporea TaxID=310782 RepID=A0A1M7ND97_9ACTN|nr:TIGR03086 family protein [Actinacidiphila paucisporea]